MLQKPVDMSATFWMVFSLCTGHLFTLSDCTKLWPKEGRRPSMQLLSGFSLGLCFHCLVWHHSCAFAQTNILQNRSNLHLFTPTYVFFPLTLQAIMPHLAFASHSVWTHFYFQLTVHKARSTKKCFLTLLWKNLTSLHKTPTMRNQTIYPTSQHWIEVPMPGVGSSIIKPSCVLIFSSI